MAWEYWVLHMQPNSQKETEEGNPWIIVFQPAHENVSGTIEVILDKLGEKDWELITMLPETTVIEKKTTETLNYLLVLKRRKWYETQE